MVGETESCFFPLRDRMGTNTKQPLDTHGHRGDLFSSLASPLKTKAIALSGARRYQGTERPFYPPNPSGKFSGQGAGRGKGLGGLWQ